MFIGENERFFMLSFLIYVLVFLSGLCIGAQLMYFFWEDEITDAHKLIDKAHDDGMRRAVDIMGGVSPCRKYGDYGDYGAPKPLPVFAMKCAGCPNDDGCPVVFGASDKDSV